MSGFLNSDMNDHVLSSFPESSWLIAVFSLSNLQFMDASKWQATYVHLPPEGLETVQRKNLLDFCSENGQLMEKVLKTVLECDSILSVVIAKVYSYYGNFILFILSVLVLVITLVCFVQFLFHVLWVWFCVYFWGAETLFRPSCLEKSFGCSAIQLKEFHMTERWITGVFFLSFWCMWPRKYMVSMILLWTYEK